MILRIAAVVTLGLTHALDTRADAIMVSNYGVASAGMPYAVALELGYFKELGVNIDNVIDGEGDAAIRALMAGRAVYAEVSPIAVLDSVRAGAALRIVSCNVQGADDYAWATKSSSTIVLAEDIRGMGPGYTNSGSSTEFLDRLASDAAYTQGSAPSYTRVGSLAAGMAFLKLGGIDVMPIPRSMWRSALADSVKLTPISGPMTDGFVDVVGIVNEDVAKTNRDLLTGILRARRKAIQYMYANPQAAAALVGKAFKVEPDDVKRIVGELQKGQTKGTAPYWAIGDLSDRCITGIRKAWTSCGRQPVIWICRRPSMQHFYRWIS